MKHVRLPLFGRLSVRENNDAYTIVEVMIFLVITGVLLISALAVFRGQQAKTQFTTAVRETDAQIRTIVNEVGSGYFPNQANFTCTAGVNGPVITNTNNAQGKNSDCIFLGKAVQFGVNGSGCNGSANNGCKSYRVFTVAGLRQHEGREIESLEEAQPTVVEVLNEDFQIPNQLFISRVLLPHDGSNCTVANGCAIGAIAYYQDLAGYEGENIVSGAQSINVYPLLNTQLGQQNVDMVAAIENPAEYSSSVNPPQGVVLCLSDGSRYAAIQIGSAGRALETDVLIDGVPQGCKA